MNFIEATFIFFPTFIIIAFFIFASVTLTMCFLYKDKLNNTTTKIAFDNNKGKLQVLMINK